MASLPARNAAPADDNVIFLRGRLAAEPETRSLPSGDELLSFRLTVSRPPGARAKVDSIDCVTTRAKVRRCLERAVPGQYLELCGALHRRFWKSAGALGSRYEVEVDDARVIRSISNPQIDGSAARKPASA